MELNRYLISIWFAAVVYLCSSVAHAQRLLCANNGTRAPPQTVLSQVRTDLTTVPGDPLSILFPTSYKNVAFVSLNTVARRNASLGIFNTSTFLPKLYQNITLPSTLVHENGTAREMALTKNEKYLIIAAGEGGFIVDTARAVAGEPGAVVGALNGTTSTQKPGVGAFDVSISPDDKFAFISQEFGGQTNDIGNVDVFSLTESDGTLQGTPIGFVSLGYLVTSTSFSPDGKLLYATSEQAASGANNGTLSVLDVKTLETNPSKAVLSNVAAGCGTVRSIVSSDGKVVWVTSREDNLLLAFDAAKLLVSDSNGALLASVTVGTSPVGLTFAQNETRILTADTNRFSIANATSGISVVDVKAVLAGKGQSGVLGRIPTGLFPREIAVSPDHQRIIVSDFVSQQLQVIDANTLP